MNHAEQIEKLIWNILEEYAEENDVKIICDAYSDGDHEEGTIEIKIYTE